MLYWPQVCGLASITVPPKQKVSLEHEFCETKKKKHTHTHTHTPLGLLCVNVSQTPFLINFMNIQDFQRNLLLEHAQSISIFFLHQ